MDTLERARRLKAMLLQIAPRGNIESITRPTLDEGPSGIFEALESVHKASDLGVIDSAMQKMAEDREDKATNQELGALEAIVMPRNRPVVFVRGTSYDDVEDPWSTLNAPEVKIRIASLFPSIGRIELPLSPAIPYGGTGFVVGKGLLMTNRHVAQLFADGIGSTIRYQTGGSAVDFKRQVDTPADDHTAYLKVRGVEMIHPYWDMALLNVDGLPEVDFLPLSTASPESVFEHNIVVIGYPARDDRSDLELQDKIFQRKYFVKRLQPGMIRSRARVRSFENMVNAMTHDASTLGGNSGSAIVDVDTGHVVALHFAGEYLKANYAVPMFELARDRRVAPRLNFDRQLAPTNDWEAAWQKVEGNEGSEPLKPQTPGKSSVPTASLQSTSQLLSNGSSGSAATWTIPLHISVSIGSPVPAAVPAFQAGEELDVEEKVVVDQDYSTRPGYDPEFLEAISVALPRLNDAMKQDTAEVDPGAQHHDDPYELAYYHYSVYMNKRRRTAWFSAANVDGDQRPAIGKRQGDRWYIDTRILKSEQLGQEAFESGIDRGHLTRREDTAWGIDVESATLANNDTFHFTNCSLQASAFNRGKDRWQGLEQFLLEQHAKKDKRRMVVITGPLFASNDPAYKNDRMNYMVRCPLQFWKVCVLIRATDEKPSATAFILGQDEIKDLPGFEEAFDVAATQIRIVDLEERTGLDFGELRDHDHFAAGGDPGTIESPVGTSRVNKGKRIRSVRDIIV